VVTSLDAPDVPVESVRAGTGEVDLRAAVAMLGARVVHVEGGPALNASLLEADLVDAVNLTFSPRLGGAHTTDAIATAFAGPRRFVLVDSVRDGDFVFARYERAR
jgi:riboflavin biosynthesis pyrimidine reductase